MYVSLEPLTGNHLDVYPEYAQDLIKNLKNEETISLGPDCFNAIIKKSGNVLTQSTPSIAKIGKSSGHRTVFQINNENVLTVYKFGHVWHGQIQDKIANAQRNLIIATCLRYPTFVSRWQWCIKPTHTFINIHEKDWISYDEDTNTQIEQAFIHGEKNVTITIAIKTYEIEFLKDDSNQLSVYALQVNTHDTTRRRICRRAMREASDFVLPNNETTCALCCEDFEDNKCIPWMRTKCKHVFHAVCFDHFKKSVAYNQKCPICRSEL